MANIPDTYPYPKLDHHIKNAWLSNLRSGRFDQATRCLCRLDGDEQSGETSSYCCLGVLGKTVGYENAALFSYDFLPDHFEHIPPSLRGYTTTAKKLAGMNDTCTPFGEIADWIEKNL